MSKEASKNVEEKSEIQDDTNEEDILAQDPDFYKGVSKFTFPNGDQYEGDFYAHVSGLIWRQGKGSYTTQDGQIYKGEWDGDKLVENKYVEINYPDGTIFCGNLLKNKYSGPGLYQVEENSSLLCNFMENVPVGDILLIDPNEKIWQGLAEKTESLLLPEHAFYQNLGQDLGKGKPRQKLSIPTKQKSTESLSQNEEKSDSTLNKNAKYSDYRDIEQQIFAKSKKTPSNLDFESSSWYQDYLTYKNEYGDIICQVKEKGINSLNIEELTWYNKYKEFEKKCVQIMNDVKLKKTIGQLSNDPVTLFEMINSEDYKDKIRPVSVFYPTEYSENSENTAKSEGG